MGRENGADFLLFEILARVAAQLRPVGEAYARRLGYMHQHAVWQFPPEWLKELHEAQIELVDLVRSIRPMQQALRHIINDEQLGGVSKIYLEDVEGAIDQMLEDIIQLQEMGCRLELAHGERRDRRMNATLFVLSVVSVIFLPAQFITGLYGMNFEDQSGKPGIPELRFKNGYIYFWILQASCLLLMSIVFMTLHCSGSDISGVLCRRCLKRIRRRKELPLQRQ